MTPAAVDTPGSTVFMRMRKMPHTVFPKGYRDAGIGSASEAFACKFDGHLVAGQLPSFRLGRGASAGSQE